MNKHSEIIEQIEAIGKWLLFQLANENEPLKHTYLRNNIAKVISLLNSIQILNRQENFNDAQILFRCLIDRLVYIFHLEENNNYEDFENWTFIKSYSHIHNARADQQVQNIKRNPLFQLSKENTNRYYELKKLKKDKFEKPKPETTLKKEGLSFIYKFGYNYASMHTHPMFFDGKEEFYQLTGLLPNPYEKYHNDDLLPNSILVSLIILQEILNSINLRFIYLIYDFIDELKKEVGNKENNSKELFYDLLNYIEKGNKAFKK